MKIKPLKIGDISAKFPVIQGGMGIGVSGWRLASAVASAGGIGVISGAGCGYKSESFDKDTVNANVSGFRNEIKKAQQASKGIIGVNIMVAMQNYAEFVKVAVEEKVDLIISGAGLPVQLPELVEDDKTKIVPIVSSLRAAQLIMKRWNKKYSRKPDAIIVEGPEAGGHLGFKKEDLIGKTAQEAIEIVKEIKNYLTGEKLDIPVILAGGILKGIDVKRALDSGADGVQMATRFVTTYECDADDAYKQAYIDAKEEDVVIMDSPVGMPGRALLNPMLETVMKGGRIPVKKCYKCVHKCDPKTTPFCITKALVNAVEGDVENSLMFVGSRVAELDHIEHVQDVFDEIERELLKA